MALFTTPGASLGGVPGSTALARLLVVISGNTQGLNASLGSAAGSLGAFQSNASSLGNTLTRSVTLPILAIGGAAISTAIQFETAMARVAGLTTLGAENVERFRDEILALSASDEIIAGPTELANSLFVAGSAGLSAAEAMSVVENSAKGASIGMGTASDISRVLIASLNVFEDDALTATQAMDALTAAVIAGSAEPNELAVALGRLLPIAEKANLTFQETVAQVAALTNLGVPTRVATTSLRALFGQFLAPTQQAEENLNALGISATELLNAVEAGPLVAFQLLSDATKGNSAVLRDIIPQIRALTGFYGLAEERLDDTARVMDIVTNSTGYLDRALSEFTDTSGFKFQNALNELEVGAIKAGAVLLPMFNGLVAIVGDFGEALQAIPQPVFAVVASILALAAAAGPLMKIWATLSTANGVFVGGLAQVKNALLLTAAAGAIAFGSLSSFAQGTGGMIQLVTGAIGAFGALAAILGVARKAAESLAIQNIVLGQSFKSTAITRFATALSGLSGAALGGIALGLTAIALGIAFVVRKSGEAERVTEQLSDSFVGAAQSGQTLRVALNTMDIPEDIANELRRIAQAAGLLDQAFASVFDRFSGAVGTELVDAIDEMVTLIPKQTGEFKKQLAIVRKAAAANEDWGKALTDAGYDVEDFTGTLDYLDGGFLAIDTAANKSVDAVQALIIEYNAARDATGDYQDQQAAQLAAHLSEQAAVEGLADTYGGSVDFIRGKLSEYGVTAQGLSGETERLWAETAGLIDSTTGEAVGALEEQRQAEQELIASRQESLRSAIDFFGGLEDISKASGAKIVSEINKITQAQVDFATNTSDLAARGLDPAALQFLVDQGPQAVAAFVDLSAKQLKAWETNFAIAMAAGDAVVLNEGKHLEGKGDAMIANFAEAILANKDITGAAASQIMATVQGALTSGQLKPAGLAAIQDFAEGIATSSDIPANKVGVVVTALVNKLADNPKFLNAGVGTVTKWAEGIARAAGLPKAAVGQIQNAILIRMRGAAREATAAGGLLAREYGAGIASQTGSVRSATDSVVSAAVSAAQGATLYPAGAQLGNSLAAGIRSTISNVISSVVQAINAAKEAADRSSRNSPEYFTYYMGQKYMDDMQRGIDSRPTPHIGRAFVGPGIGGGPGNGSMRGLRIEGTLDTPWGPGKVKGIIRDELKDGRLVDRGMARAVARQRVR